MSEFSKVLAIDCTHFACNVCLMPERNPLYSAHPTYRRTLNCLLIFQSVRKSALVDDDDVMYMLVTCINECNSEFIASVFV